jgi:hypothetical protein
LAYTAWAEGQKIHPVVADYYFNAGPVIGEFHETSTEVGLGQRFEDTRTIFRTKARSVSWSTLAERI